MKQIFHSIAILLWMALLSSFGLPLTSLVSADTVPLTCDVVLDISNSPHETETFVPDTNFANDGIGQILTNRLGLQANSIESISVSYQLEEGFGSDHLATFGNEEKEEDSEHRRFLRKKRKPKKQKPKKKTKIAPAEELLPCPKIWYGCGPKPPTYDDDYGSYTFPSNSWHRAKDQDERKLQTIDHIRHGDTSFEKIHEDVQKDICNELRTVHDILFEKCTIYFHCGELNSADASKNLAWANKKTRSATYR